MRKARVKSEFEKDAENLRKQTEKNYINWVKKGWVNIVAKEGKKTT